MAMIAIGAKPKIDKTVPVPQVPINGAGAQFDAIAQGAGQVAQFGQELLDKRKRASDNEFVSTQITNDMVEFTKFESDLKKTTPENGAGYADAVKQWQADRVDKNLANAPSSDAAAVYKNKFQDFSTRNVIQAETDQATKAAEYSANQIVNNVNKSASMLLASPRVDRAWVVRKENEDMIQANVGVHYDQATADKFKKEANKKIGISVLDGLDAQENYGLAKKMLTSAGKEGDLLSDLDSEERGRLLKRFDNAIEQKKTKNTAIAVENASDFTSAALNGDTLAPGLAEKRIAEIQYSNLEPEKKTRMIDTIKSAAIANAQAQTYKTLPPSKWQRPEDAIQKESSGFNAASREKAVNSLAATQAAVIKQREDDAATYTMANYPKLAIQYKALDSGDPQASQDFAKSLLATQGALEIKNQRILPKVYSQAIGTQLASPGDTDKALGAVMQMEQQWGPYKNKVMNEIITDNKLPDGYRILPFVSDVNSKRKILDNLKLGKAAEIEKNFTVAKGADYTVKDVSDEVSSQLSPYQAAVMSGGDNRASLYTAMNEQVKLQAMRRMMNGEKLSNAVEKSKAEILDNSFSVVESGNAPTLIPKVMTDGRTPINTEAVHNTIHHLSTPAGLQSLDLKAPDTFDAKAELKKKSPYARFWMEDKTSGASLFAQQVASQVRWVSTVNGDAIMPVVKNKWGKDVSLTNSKNEPVKIKFSDINSEAAEWAKKSQAEKDKIFQMNEAKASMDIFKTGN